MDANDLKGPAVDWQEMETVRAPYLEKAKLAHQDCVSWAQLIVKSGFVLNGGGLVFLPAIAGLKSEKIGDAQGIINACMLNVGGLLVTWLAGLIAYFVTCYGERSARNSVLITENVVLVRHGHLTKVDFIQKTAALRDNVRIDDRKYRTGRAVCILLTFLSIILYAIACWEAYPVLSAPSGSALSVGSQMCIKPPTKQ